jgi:hypothetical protein
VTIHNADALLADMTDRADEALCSLEALRSGMEWSAIRTKARALLARYGYVDYRSRLSWLTYVASTGPASPRAARTPR